MAFNECSTLVLYVNGLKIVDNDINPEWSLLTFLRKKLRLCGTKLGCGEGGCGACTVMVSKYNREEQRIERIRHFSVNACLAPVCSMHGLAVTTVEGIGSTKDRLHPVQERIYKSHGSQCGFCTPGIVMSMYTLLRNNHHPSLHELEINFQGNLCRCTGYRPILECFKSFTTDACCRSKGNCETNSNNNNCKINSQCCQMNGFSEEDEDDHIRVTSSKFRSYDDSQEPIFPPQLQLSDEYDKQFLKIKGNEITWFRPTSLEGLLQLKTQFPISTITVGNTEVGIEMKFKNCNYPILISPTAIPELNAISWQEDGITVGAAVTLSRLNDCLIDATQKLPEFKTRIFAAIIEMLRWFAGKQIRNVASLGGNIMTASPISDLNPLLMAAGSRLQLISKKGIRTVNMNDNFFLSYRKTVIKQDEVLLSIFIPYSHPNEFFFGFKQAQRREDDIAIVNAGFRVRFNGESEVIQQLSLAFGGMAPTTVLATKTMETLCGRRWNNSMVTEGCSLLLDDLPLNPDAPGGMVAFRKTVALSFFFKFFLKIKAKLIETRTDLFNEIPNAWLNSARVFSRDFPKGSQYYQIKNTGQRTEDPIGQPIPHKSGALHTTGEAVYCDDMIDLPDQLYLSFVTSTRAHARILSVDASLALELTGVHAFFTADDLPGDRNKCGLMSKDLEYFAKNKVNCHGQIIGAIVADEKSTAQRAAKLVKVSYEDLQPVILSIQEAIAAESFFQKHVHIIRSEHDVGEYIANSEHVLEGEMSVGGQEHFYMEPHCGYVVPDKESNEITITISCQAPFFTQTMVAEALKIPANKVVVKTKRLGGGFGGKGFQASYLAIPAALAAIKLRRPVRYCLDRDEDMGMTGGRHPFLIKYKIGFTSTGKVRALSATLFSNGGHALDASSAVMKKSLEKFTSAYNIPVCEFFGFICKTNLLPNTAVRGFGAPQSYIVMQSIMEDIASFLGKDSLHIKQMNLVSEGDRTFYGQEITSCTAKRCWDECLQTSDYKFRKTAVETFNKENRWKKRGLALVPMMYGVSFYPTYFNQGAALVLIYEDGSVLVTHGGVEMGQGLHIKTMQVASSVLGIPLTKIHLSETSTDKVPNATPTAGSMGTDLFAAAVKNACETLLNRLEPYKTLNPKDSWEDWVRAAYKDRVCLSATGFHKTHDGKHYLYFSYGAGCSEVEIDCLTGDHQVLRTDIVMDVGDSINPAIDIGQIEGAFIQGYGLHTMEELKYSPQGYLYTRGPGTYKIPGFGDIPSEFNVSLLKGSPNVHAIYSSKAIGEPPLLLASSVFMAIKDAIRSARDDVGLKGIFRLDSPATAERIRMACSDQFTQMVEETQKDSEKFVPWSISIC